MLNTVEMRWFFDTCPIDETQHFAHVGELQTRVDWYSMPCNPASGIKIREGRFESKLRTAELGKRRLGSLHGRLEQWQKWSLAYVDDSPPPESLLSEIGWIAVSKRRRLKRFAVQAKQLEIVDLRPNNGCEFELTELVIRDQSFWTVGFEAVGEADQLERNLALVAERVQQDGGRQLDFLLERSFGYAEWLCHWNQR